MHFRICCCGSGDEKAKTAETGNSVPSQIIVPTIVVTEEPKPVESIQLDRTTEVAVEESSLPSTQETESARVAESSIQETISEPPIGNESTTSVEQSSRPVPQIIPEPVLLESSRSNCSVNTTIGDDSVQFNQVAPGWFRGFFNGGQFMIANGEFYTIDGAFSDRDKEIVMKSYTRLQSNMPNGVNRLEAGVTSLSSIFGQQVSPSTSRPIHINFKTSTGEDSQMVLHLIEPGHFRGKYMGKEFSILNGQILTTDGNDEGLDKELILMNFEMGMMGMQQGILGMQQGMIGMKMGMLGMQANLLGMNAGLMRNLNASQSSQSVLATGRETLKRMRSLNHGKRISILEGGLIAQPRQPMVIEDVTKKPEYDGVDGHQMSNESLPEPALRKTTFTPNAVIYDDPKTYEKLDKNELPTAKRLDEYIISQDESENAGNRYYFHAARPRRVTRKPLNPKDQLRIASPDRYSLFESESVKVHNEYRKMHGVPPLVNNEFLCEVAREWAEHLALKDAFYHRPKNEYGENLYYADGMSVCAKKAAKAWYDEIDLYDYNNPKFSKETGHFTQLVWKDTREMGTGVAQIGDKVWVCCNYHPPGNYTDKFNDEYVPRPVIKRAQ